MKSRKIFLVLVIPLVAAMLATTSGSAAIVPDHGPSAFGAGLFRFRNSQAELELWSFSFEAVANKNGHTRGRAQFDNLTAHTQVVVRINCLNLEPDFIGVRAVMSGIVLHSDDPLHPKMQTVLFAASDGPLLPSSTADTITPPFELPPLDGQQLTCRDGGPLTILDVEQGDIQVNP